jgi:hypothetical protein
MPSGIVAGELLILFCRVAENDDPDAVSGWTSFFGPINAGGSSDDWNRFFWRKATGGEGSSVGWTTGTNMRTVSMCARISGAADPTVTPPQMAHTFGGFGANPNPPNLTPSGGAKDYLWLAGFGSDRDFGGDPPATAPSGYSGWNDYGATSGSATSSTNLGFGYKQANAASEDPGVVTLTSSWWLAFTIAIHPGAEFVPKVIWI